MQQDITPVVEVIIPVFNVEQYLGDCLESLVMQTFTEWRAIIVLDGPTDNSAAIASAAAAADPRITVHAFSNAGLGAARNRGLSLSDSRYVMFVDSDDVLPHGALESLVHAAVTTEAQIVSGFAVQSETMHTTWPYWTMQDRAANTWNSTTTLRKSPQLVLDHTAWNKLYLREFLLENNIRYPEGTTCEDVVPTLRAYATAGRISVIEESVYIHRRRPGSITTSGHHGDRAISDWVTQTALAATLIKEIADEHVSHTYFRRLLKSEAWTRVRNWPSLSDESAERVRVLVSSLLEEAPASAVEELDAFQHAMYALLQRADRQAAESLSSDAPNTELSPKERADVVAGLERLLVGRPGYRDALARVVRLQILQPYADDPLPTDPATADLLRCLPIGILLSAGSEAALVRDDLCSASVRSSVNEDTRCARVRQVRFGAAGFVEVRLDRELNTGATLMLIDMDTDHEYRFRRIAGDLWRGRIAVRRTGARLRVLFAVRGVVAADPEATLGLRWAESHTSCSTRLSSFGIQAAADVPWQGVELHARGSLAGRAARALIRRLRHRRPGRARRTNA